MRRISSVALLLAILAALAVTPSSTVQAGEGDPGDYCTQSPDRPLGWLFSDACRGHDECLAALDVPVERAERLACDDSFLELLLDARKADGDAICGRSPLCQVLARVYHYVVRMVTLELVPNLQSAGVNFP